MPATTSRANSWLDDLNATLTMTLHTADPGGTGANEVTGGSYAGQSVTMAAASNKSRTSSSTVTFAGMPATTATHFQLKNGATIEVYGPLSTSFTVTAGQSIQFDPGEVTVNIS